VQWESAPVEIPYGQMTERGWVPTPPVLLNDEFSELARAAEWLRTHLSGKSEFSTAIQQEAKQHDISLRTLRRAFRRLNGFPSRDKATRKWLWHLPVNLSTARPCAESTDEQSRALPQPVETSAVAEELDRPTPGESMLVESRQVNCGAICSDPQPEIFETIESTPTEMAAIPERDAADTQNAFSGQHDPETSERTGRSELADQSNTGKLVNLGQTWPSTKKVLKSNESGMLAKGDQCRPRHNRFVQPTDRSRNSSRSNNASVTQHDSPARSVPTTMAAQAANSR